MALGLAITATIITVIGWYPNCDGERRYEEYTGKLKWINIACDVCCHVNSAFKLEGQKPVSILNCEKELECCIDTNQTVTIYCKPSSEMYATTNGCYWSLYIYKIEDVYGNEIWKS